MSQRSQIYVRLVRLNYENGHAKKEICLIANDYGWNFAERMISRARYAIERITEHQRHGSGCFGESDILKLRRILDVNFDMKDIVLSSDILKEYEEYGSDENLNEFVFNNQDNCDGQLYIDILENGNIRYAFLDWDADAENVMDAESYMAWDMRGSDWQTPTEHMSQKVIDTCLENIKEIKSMALLMTAEEVLKFKYDNYSHLVNRKG